MTSSGAPSEPADFRAAVESLHSARVRREIEVGPIRPPQRLAPYSYAVGAEVGQTGVEIASPDAANEAQGSAFGRLILLYDPAGQDAWDGTIRLVAYIQAEVEADLAMDPLLPEVAWSWLSDALGVPVGQNASDSSIPAHDGVDVTALGGTVTSTTSVRYGDIAGPPRAHQLELRASWTAPTAEGLGGHLEAFCDVLASAAGLPPVGITELGSA